MILLINTLSIPRISESLPAGDTSTAAKVDGACIKMPHVAFCRLGNHYKRHFGILIENCDHISLVDAVNTENYFNDGNKLAVIYGNGCLSFRGRTYI